MSFTRVNPPGWAVGAKVTSAQLNSLDIDHAKALDKTGDTVTGAIGFAGGSSLTGTITVPTGTTVALQSGAVVTAVAGVLHADDLSPVATNGSVTIRQSGTQPYVTYASWSTATGAQSQLNTVYGSSLTTASSGSPGGSTIVFYVPKSNSVVFGTVQICARDNTNSSNVGSQSYDVVARNNGAGVTVTSVLLSSLGLGTNPITSASFSPSGLAVVINVTASSANSIDWQIMARVQQN